MSITTPFPMEDLFELRLDGALATVQPADSPPTARKTIAARAHTFRSRMAAMLARIRCNLAGQLCCSCEEQRDCGLVIGAAG